jgi:hypothetical protein
VAVPAHSVLWNHAALKAYTINGDSHGTVRIVIGLSRQYCVHLTGQPGQTQSLGTLVFQTY